MGAAILASLFVAGTVSARPVAGELAARSRASISISVSVRPRFDVRRDAQRHGTDAGAIAVSSNFGSRFSIRDDSSAPAGLTGTTPSPLLIIVPD